jgi:DNA-binding response OmpR family regulator
MAGLLVVDDDEEAAGLLADVLRCEGHDVRVGRNGNEGLRLVAEQHPDLLLLDVEMPGLTGPEMSQRMLIQNCGLEKIPVLLLSGVLDLPRVAVMVGTPYFLPKPYGLNELLALVARALSERIPPKPRLPNDGETL